MPKKRKRTKRSRLPPLLALLILISVFSFIVLSTVLLSERKEIMAINSMDGQISKIVIQSLEKSKIPEIDREVNKTI